MLGLKSISGVDTAESGSPETPLLEQNNRKPRKNHQLWINLVERAALETVRNPALESWILPNNL